MFTFLSAITWKSKWMFYSWWITWDWSCFHVFCRSAEGVLSNRLPEHCNKKCIWRRTKLCSDFYITPREGKPYTDTVCASLKNSIPCLVDTLDECKRRVFWLAPLFFIANFLISHTFLKIMKDEGRRMGYIFKSNFTIKFIYFIFQSLLPP